MLGAASLGGAGTPLQTLPDFALPDLSICPSRPPPALPLTSLLAADLPQPAEKASCPSHQTYLSEPTIPFSNPDPRHTPLIAPGFVPLPGKPRDRFPRPSSPTPASLPSRLSIDIPLAVTLARLPRSIFLRWWPEGLPSRFPAFRLWLQPWPHRHRHRHPHPRPLNPKYLRLRSFTPRHCCVLMPV